MTMNSNGLSMLNVGTSLDFGALTAQQNNNHDEDHEESEVDDDEDQKRDEAVIVWILQPFNYISNKCINISVEGCAIKWLWWSKYG